MSAHTPGSWVAERIGAIRTLSKTHERRLARGIVTPQVAAALGDEKIDDEERMANARLIAAAPKLLAALERLADNTEGRNLRGQTQETALRQAIAEARAAIAEARGGK